MGRTRRKRNHKKPLRFHTCNNEKESVLLNSWLSNHNVHFSKKLVLAVFDDTGRGVLTKKRIVAGEELMNLPLNITINVTSLLMDTAFCSIFLQNTKSCLVEYQNSVTFQSLMAFYILFLKVQGNRSKWCIYIRSLPQTYTVPYFLPNNVKNHIQDEIKTVIARQKNIINTSYNIFENILKNTVSNNRVVIDFKKYFCMFEFEWAYFTINTRCVYMDLTKLIDLQSNKSTILSIIKDDTKISLCPYLDMINHSPNAKNETKLIVSKDLDLVPMQLLEENIFSDVRFSIYTKNNFDPYTQIFICYGDSHNLKLITEYGFFLPSNDLDCVAFDFDNIVLLINSHGIHFSSDQMSFILNHGLDKNLYIDLRGLSFNLCSLIMVAQYYYKKDVDISKMIYTAAVCSEDKVLVEFTKPMLKQKLLDLSEMLSKLHSFRKCIILDNCIQLMCQHIRILEKWTKY